MGRNVGELPDGLEEEDISFASRIEHDYDEAGVWQVNITKGLVKNYNKMKVTHPEEFNPQLARDAKKSLLAVRDGDFKPLVDVFKRVEQIPKQIQIGGKKNRGKTNLLKTLDVMSYYRTSGCNTMYLVNPSVGRMHGYLSTFGSSLESLKVVIDPLLSPYKYDGSAEVTWDSYKASIFAFSELVEIVEGPLEELDPEGYYWLGMSKIPRNMSGAAPHYWLRYDVSPWDISPNQARITEWEELGHTGVRFSYKEIGMPECSSEYLYAPVAYRYDCNTIREVFNKLAPRSWKKGDGTNFYVESSAPLSGFTFDVQIRSTSKGCIPVEDAYYYRGTLKFTKTEAYDSGGNFMYAVDRRGKITYPVGSGGWQMDPGDNSVASKANYMIHPAVVGVLDLGERFQVKGQEVSELIAGEKQFYKRIEGGHRPGFMYAGYAQHDTGHMLISGTVHDARPIVLYKEHPICNTIRTRLEHYWDIKDTYMRTKAYGPRIIYQLVDEDPIIEEQIEGASLADVWFIGIAREITKWLRPIDLVHLSRVAKSFSSTKRMDEQPYTPILQKSWSMRYDNARVLSFISVYVKNSCACLAQQSDRPRQLSILMYQHLSDLLLAELGATPEVRVDRIVGDWNKVSMIPDDPEYKDTFFSHWYYGGDDKVSLIYGRQRTLVAGLEYCATLQVYHLRNKVMFTIKARGRTEEEARCLAMYRLARQFFDVRCGVDYDNWYPVMLEHVQEYRPMESKLRAQPLTIAQIDDVWERHGITVAEELRDIFPA
jgi:hypothetical protein